ncbi:MAG: hypothetical protein LBF04_06830, partial [Prevotellaceae bacterium]|nr:hypothetical protein [Prevotellaceae bacterium]
VFTVAAVIFLSFDKLAAQTKDSIKIDPALRQLVNSTFTTLDEKTLKDAMEFIQLEFNKPASKVKTPEEQKLFVELVQAFLD